METVTLKGTDFTGALGLSDSVPIQGAPAGTAAFFSQQTAFSSGTAHFAINSVDAVPQMVIEMTGFDDPRETKAPMQIVLNGAVVWQGPSPFPNANWGTYGLLLRDISMVKVGENVITISNTSPQGGLAQPPWFLIQSVTIHYR